MHLGEVATVRSGLVLSRKQAKKPSAYRYQLLNLKSIHADAYIKKDLLDIYDAVEQLNPEYLTQKGDIVIRLSSPYTAVLIDETAIGLVISSNFTVVRANHDRVLPEYLFWLLNTSNVKKDILKHNTSNMLGAIRPQYYNDFEVVLLPLIQQKKIAKLNLLARRESRLMQDLACMKKQYYTIMIDEVQRKMRRGNIQ